MAAKDNTSPSQIDKGTFFWNGMCGICHPGGGPAEYDRDGERLYDEVSGQFGYEVLGKTAAQVIHDGDYAWINPSNGQLGVAQWDVTGLTEPDCLLCHRAERTVNNGKDMAWVWRAGTQRGMHTLVDAQAASVPAYAASATAAQGWFSGITMAPGVSPPKATMLQIDYATGVADGSLSIDKDNQLVLSGLSIVGAPRDRACWGCHAIADQKKRGRVWFDPDKDVHYAYFNNFTDDDPGNDIADPDSAACTICHPSEIEHNFAKGSSYAGSVRDDLDYVDFKMCADCHSDEECGGDDELSGPPPTSPIHTSAHLNTMACQFCHVPFKYDSAQLIVDNSVTGSSVGYNTDAFLSADPLNPADPDKSRWYPSGELKNDPDGHRRLYPVKDLLTAWWGDWDDNGTPGTSSPETNDDVIAPVILWRMRFITSGAALPGVVDDNGDGKPEVNTDAEILAYITALKGNDQHGNQVAARPVLIKGGKVYYEDAGAPSGVGHFEYHGTGIKVESMVAFSVDHNVLKPDVALGSIGCIECHRNLNHGNPTRVFDRLILVDPFGDTGAPVYSTLREISGVNPF